MIVEFPMFDLLRLLGTSGISKGELVDIFAMYGCPPEPPEGDTLRVEVFPNRPDLLMVEGAARALKGILGIESGFRLYTPAPALSIVKVDGSVTAIRPHCSFAIIRGVTMDDQTVASIMQVQEKLHQTHGRKRRKVAIGIHDLDTIEFPLTYLAAEPDSTSFIPLDSAGKMTLHEILRSHPKGREFAHLLDGKPLYPLIVDSRGIVLSMPPIINGEHTRVTPRTKNLLVDVTGTDEDAVDEACTIIATGLAERGARIELVNTGGRVTPDLSPRKMILSVGYCNRMLGLQLEPEEMAALLAKMRFGAQILGSDRIEVSVPAYRADCMHQIDLVEDVAIAYGYPNFEPEIPALPTIGNEHAVLARSGKAKDVMIGLGYQEVFTFAMTSPEKLFSKMGTGARQVAAVSNPKTEEFTVVRDKLLPSMLEVLSVNKHNPYPQAVFETGDVVVLDDAADVRCRTRRDLAAVLAGGTFEQAKGHLECLLRQLGIQASFAPSSRDYFLAGRQAEISVAGKPVGAIGEMHPQVLENWGIDVPTVGFGLMLE